MQHIELCITDKNRPRIELSSSYCFAANLRNVEVASRYRPDSSSCDLSIRTVLNFNFEFKVLTDRNKRSET